MASANGSPWATLSSAQHSLSKFLRSRLVPDLLVKAASKASWLLSPPLAASLGPAAHCRREPGSDIPKLLLLDEDWVWQPTTCPALIATGWSLAALRVESWPVGSLMRGPPTGEPDNLFREEE